MEGMIPMSDPEILTIPSVATVGASEAIGASLKAALSTFPNVVVDCSAIEEADISFVQLLIAARRSAKRGGKKLRLKSPASGQLLSILVRSGLVSKESGQSEDDKFWLIEGE